MHRVRNSSWNPILFVLPYKNSDLRMRKKEILRRRGPMKSHIQTYALCLMLLSLSVPFFFLLSMSLLCVCNCSLFVFPPLTFFFLFVCPPSIYRETPKEFFPYFSLNWSDHGAVFVSFSSTFPNSMLGHDPLFSFLLFLSVPLLFKLPLFGLWHPHFSAFQAHFHETLLLTFTCCHFPFTFFFFF